MGRRFVRIARSLGKRSGLNDVQTIRYALARNITSASFAMTGFPAAAVASGEKH